GPRAAAAPVPDPLALACRQVLAFQGARIDPDLPPSDDRPPALRLRSLGERSGVRFRRVLLRGEWWRRDCGPLVAFLGEPESPSDSGDPSPGLPIALLPASSSSYEAIGPDAVRHAVDGRIAGRISTVAYMLYPPLRLDSLRELLGWLLRRRRSDLWGIAFTTVAGGLLSLFVPIVTEALFGRVLPQGMRSAVPPLVLALILCAVGAAGFQLVRSACVLQVTGGLDGFVQPALWNRLLRLPVSFFRRYSADGLANRSLGVDATRELLLVDVSSSILGLVISLGSLALLVFYSWRLSLVAAGLVFLLTAASVALIRRGLVHERRLLQLQDRISSLAFELVQGIAKLRASGGEAQAFRRWESLDRERRSEALRSSRIGQLRAVLSAVYGLAGQMLVFACVGLGLAGPLDAGRFLAWSVAYGQLQAAALSFLAVVPQLLPAIPLYERLRAIAEADLEVEGRRGAAVLDLAGALEVRGVSFRYPGQAEAVLRDVELRIEPGEFVAIVGPSGSGKSTLLRLLLGFEEPGRGQILYDGHDLATLDVAALRRQIGVVLQNAQPIQGDIYSNIVGSTDLGMDVAWEAARLAGIDADIRAMPRGMHTMIGQGLTAFSGGQLQRVMIARALAHRPRLLLLDEATSALDNPTQEVVRRSLAAIRATRIVIAHRLSTIRGADRIHVLSGGRIVETGSYDELYSRNGPFRELAQRQLE
ncbi:MAG TPA: NHLP bacteriocin export ABC transporter permease/ATPase subunit, partial [Thermoanaerobaculia bacterium]